MNYSCVIPKSILILLSLCLMTASPSFSQKRFEKYKRGVVNIKVSAPDRPDETGSGIVISKDLTHVFVLTALHVVFDVNTERLDDLRQKKIQVKFRSGPEWSDATLFESIEEDLDVALLKVEINSTQYENLKTSLKLGHVNKLKVDQVVHIIGHPQHIDWKLGDGTLKKKEVHYLSFSGGIADRGNSGGALLDKYYSLIGMVRNIDPDYGRAVSMLTAKEKVEEWQVPFDLKYKKVHYWGYAAGALGVTGVTFKLLSDAKYDQYKNATDNDEAEKLKQQVQTFDIIYPVALAASAACLTTWLLSSKEKKKKQNKVQVGCLPYSHGGVMYVSMKF